MLLQPKSSILCFIVFLLSFFTHSQTNNYILIDEDQMETIEVHIDGSIASNLNLFFDTPLGPTHGGFPNAPQGDFAFVINTIVGYTGIVFDKTVNACPGASYYYKFFIGNEYTTSDLPNHGPNITVQIEDAVGTILWSQNYPNIQYAFQEITTSTFVPTTSTIHFKIFSNLYNPPNGGDGVYSNDAVFDHLRLYQNNPSYNYQTATGSAGVSFCSSDPAENLSNYLYWPMSSGTWSGLSSLPNPSGNFNPSTDNAGLYTFTNNNSAVCPDTTSQVNVLVAPGPDIDPQSGIIFPSCGPITLPAISGTNIPASAAYYTGTNGSGTQYNPGDQISSTITLYAFATTGSCSDEETYQFNTTPLPNPGNDTTAQYCSSSSPIDLDDLIAPADAGSWSETSTTSSGNFNTTSAILNVPSTSPGIYTFIHIANSAFPCPADTAFLAITINNPVINPIANSTVCETFTFPPIAGSDLSGNEAYYTGLAGTGTEYNPGDQIASSDTIYVFDVSPTDATCWAQEAFIVTVNQQNTAGNNFTSTYCAAYNNIDIDTLITGQDAGGTWVNLNGATSFNAATNTIDIASEVDGDYVFQYVVNSSTPCLNDTATATIHISNTTINPITDTTACENFTLATIIGDNLSGNQAYYTGSSGTGTQYNQGDVISNSETLYAYDVSPTDAACFAEKSFDITINQQLNAGNDFTSSYCTRTGAVDLDTLITGQDVGGVWINLDNATSFDATDITINTNSETEGTYVFQYIVNSSAPCQNDTAKVEITVLEEPTINLTVSDTLACFPGTFSFFSGSNSNPNYEYNWNFGNGNSSALENPTVTYGVVGCFDINLTISNIGGMCSVDTTVTDMVCVISAPIADFTTDQDTLVPGNNILTGTNYTTNANSYWWHFGDGTTDTTFELNHAYDIEESGDYTITLVATNVAGCSDTMTAKVYLQNELKIVLPNIFTPNGDNANDIYTVNMQGVKHIQWIIVNRWGNEMTTGNTATSPTEQQYPIWKGEDANEGVYFIVLKYTNLKDEVSVIQQHITISR